MPSHTTGWRRIHVTNGEHPYMGHWWVPGLVIGYEHSFVHAVADFLKGLETGEPAQPDFRARAADAEGVRRGAALGAGGAVGGEQDLGQQAIEGAAATRLVSQRTLSRTALSAVALRRVTTAIAGAGVERRGRGMEELGATQNQAAASTDLTLAARLGGGSGV